MVVYTKKYQTLIIKISENDSHCPSIVLKTTDGSIVKQMEKEKNSNFIVENFVVMFIYWGTINIYIYMYFWSQISMIVTWPTNTRGWNLILLSQYFDSLQFHVSRCRFQAHLFQYLQEQTWHIHVYTVHQKLTDLMVDVML